MWILRCTERVFFIACFSAVELPSVVSYFTHMPERVTGKYQKITPFCDKLL